MIQAPHVQLEAWEVLPTKMAACEKFELPNTKAVLFVVHAECEQSSAAFAAAGESFLKLAAELQKAEPNSTAILLPGGWCFRIMRYDPSVEIDDADERPE